MVTISTHCSSPLDVHAQEHDSVTGTMNYDDDSQLVDGSADIVAETNDMTSSTNPAGDTEFLTNSPKALLVNNEPESPEVVAGREFHAVPHCSEELKPFVGQQFDNLEQGLDFYKEYAKACGFIPRLDSSKLVDGVITHKCCVCNKEGKLFPSTLHH